MRWNLNSNSGNNNIWLRAQNSGGQSQPATFYLDNIRIYPVDAVCTSQTYNPVTFDVISTTDENGVTRYKATDSFGRATATAK